MDDNARPHRANLVDEFLESEDIKRITWPANSPDLNPIENLWDYLGRAIARRHPPPRDVNGLKTALLEEWSLIPQTVINNFISSLKTRCDMCVRGLGPNPGEDIDVCKCIVPLRHRDILNGRRAASPLGVVWEDPDPFQLSSLKIGVETSQIVLSPVWGSKLQLTKSDT
ncbi:transposable element Tcb2 transposase [Trichonephila clavipes]|nr:transposable element Tcb2 transposase [Trichonephila clavipes]